MDHFTIFQDFYRVIAEMTEEEIVSAISNGTYRETVEDVRRIFAEQGEKAANEKKIELPEITFSANYRGGRSNATLVKYLGIKGSDFVISSMMEIFNFLNCFGQCPVCPASSHWQKSVPTPASLSSAPKEWD